jgi:Fe-S-cluster containining protein
MKRSQYYLNMKTTFEAKINKLYDIYARSERETALFRQHAFCKAGCSFCCTFMGNIDIVTLEGLVILEYIKDQPEEFRVALKKRISINKNEKEKGCKAHCPFLLENKTCLIYAIRPFSCRQLYSLRQCGDSQPMAHRQAVESAQSTVKEMQQLDDTGYSGHISYILHLLDDTSFRKLYLSGRFTPERIMKFGKEHGLIINRFAK